MTKTKLLDINVFLREVAQKFAREKGIDLIFLNDGWVTVLKKGDKTHVLIGPEIGLNRSSSSAVARDKAACYEVLNFSGVGAVEHILLLKPNTPASDFVGNFEKAFEYLKKHKKVVLKPNKGMMGIDVFLAEDKEELKSVLNYLFSNHRAVAISPFVEATAEYRVTVLNGEVMLVYKKIAPKNTFKFNLSQGAKAEIEKDQKIAEKVGALAKKAAKSLGLIFANVDILYTKEKDFKVLEVNSGVAFEKFSQANEVHRKIAEDIYFKAFDLVYKKYLS